MKTDNKYTNNRNNKPNLKKCEGCGAYGQSNRSCKYWSYDNLTEWACCHPRAKKED